MSELHNISHLPIHKVYPGLTEIHNPPEKLFVQGDPSFLLETTPIAFVGSRACSSYGKAVCKKLIQELAPYPVSIISGLALGIDTIAHKKALEVALPTAAILGSGLSHEVLYPKTHLHIAQAIVEKGGCLISEYEYKQKPLPYMFPQRNRIIAGISTLIVIIECEKKSGTMITGKMGLECNKDICVVPHSIFSPTGAGPFSLLQEGAHAIQHGDDIADILGFKKENSPQQKIPYISDEENVLLSCIRKPITKNSLFEMLDMPFATIQKILIQLEIKNIIQEKNGLLYKKI